MVKDRSKICLCISAAIMIIALVMSIAGSGINLGIDFAGGMSMEYDLGTPDYALDDVRAVLNAQNLGEYNIAQQGTQVVKITIRDIKEEDTQNVQSTLQAALTEKYSALTTSGEVSYVGPVAGATLIRNAIWSVVIASVLMLIYIAIRFDLSSGIAAVLGLVHDVLIMLSFMVLLRSIIQMNSSFIAAMLTIVGYSINNTIVIFDRIRENARKNGALAPVEVVNTSIRECLGRTINTTLTTLITIVALYVMGVDSIKEFALPIIIGIVSGVYSANMINGYIWARLQKTALAGKARKA